MLTSYPSPQFSAPSSKYSAPNVASFSRRSSNSTARIAHSPRTSPRASFGNSGTQSPSLSRARVPSSGFRSPKRPTSDAATQYTPPGLPPTAQHTKPSVTKPPVKLNTATNTGSTGPDCETAQAHSAAQHVPKEPPPEPQIRETPESAAATASLSDHGRVSPSAPNTLRSGVKRQKQEGVEVKILPIDYAQCEAKVLATLISELLMDLIHHNDHIKLEDGNLTRFHSRTPPGISVHDYLHRLTFHATLPPSVLLAMVSYIDKLCEAFPIFTINSLTVHRFLIAAATVAAKGLCDVFWTNSTYAKVGGVSKKELALLELELLTKIEWRIVPNPEKLGDYYRSVVENHPDYAFEESDSSRTTSSDSIGTDTMDTE